MQFPDKANPYLEMSEEEFVLWQHSPTTAAFFNYLDHLVDAWRETAADLLEAGAYTSKSDHEDANPDVVRGRILAVRALRGITLASIQGFYGKEPAAEVTETQVHAEPD